VWEIGVSLAGLAHRRLKRLEIYKIGAMKYCKEDDNTSLHAALVAVCERSLGSRGFLREHLLFLICQSMLLQQLQSQGMLVRSRRTLVVRKKCGSIWGMRLLFLRSQGMLVRSRLTLVISKNCGSIWGMRLLFLQSQGTRLRLRWTLVHSQLRVHLLCRRNRGPDAVWIASWFRFDLFEASFVYQSSLVLC